MFSGQCDMAKDSILCVWHWSNPSPKKWLYQNNSNLLCSRNFILDSNSNEKKSSTSDGIPKNIKAKVLCSPICIQDSSNRHEPLISSIFPYYPLQKASLDLFKLEEKWYLVIVHHIFEYFEINSRHNYWIPFQYVFWKYRILQQLFSGDYSQFSHLKFSEF